MQLSFIIKKIISLLISIFIVVSLTFVLMKTIPGDPFSDEKALPEEIHNALLKHYGLKDPWYQQYIKYIKSIVTWDLGPSFTDNARTVNEIIKQGFSISVVLGLEAFSIALAFGVALGVAAAIHRGTRDDYLTMIFATIGISVPSFILATLLQYILAFKLGWLPVARWGSFSQSILPAISLAAMPMGFIARLVRSNMIDVLQQDYIKTARSKGLPQRYVLFHHCLRNALCPLLPYLGQLMTNILVGSFVIESIFGIPGLGQWFVNSVNNRDYPVIMGTTVFYSLILLTTLFFADILYSRLDPRINQVAK